MLSTEEKKKAHFALYNSFLSTLSTEDWHGKARNFYMDCYFHEAFDRATAALLDYEKRWEKKEGEKI